MKDLKNIDNKLIDDIRKGGRDREAALKNIFQDQRKRNRVLSYLRSKGCSNHDAEDLYQDAILIFYRKVTNNDYLTVASIDSYVFNIAKLNWYNKYRKIRNFGTEEIDYDQAIEEDATQYYARKERAEILDQVLSKFGERCKQMLLLYSQNYNLKEIAQQLNMVDAERVRKEKYRCLNRMRKSVLQDQALSIFIKSQLTPDQQ